MILIIKDEMTRDELQEKLQLKDRENFCISLKAEQL
ncbi:MAG: hypothetical protein ACOYVE_11500 [Melioribacter sp.]